MKAHSHPTLVRPFKLIGRFFTASQRRFRLSRPGSVLILCIALLVLLALIGTAMISTAGIDRYASVQHTYNTQVDLMVQSVESMAKGWIEGGLQQAQTGNVSSQLFRPADQDIDQTIACNYRKYDAITPGPCNTIATAGAQDMWLSPRVPQLTNLSLPISPANPPEWQTITMPLAAQMTGGASVYQFESPWNPNVASSQAPVPLTTQARDGAQPTFTPLTPSGNVFPALFMTGAGSFMAADTDGDGIADALYFKLFKSGDITYYAAARIIDNNSAINANTAWSRDYDFTNAATGFRRDTGQGTLIAGTTNFGFFRSNVGFMEMFPDYNNAATTATKPGTSEQMNGVAGAANSTPSINGYRFGGLNAASDYSAPPSVWYWDPVSKKEVARHDFMYSTQGDGLEFGLASRLDNPGYNYFSPDGSTTPNFRAFSWSDTAALVSRFAILNPSASASELETDGYKGLMQLWTIAGGSASITSTPYQANAVDAAHNTDLFGWYNQNFDYDSGSEAVSAFHPIQYQRMPLRPILVSRDPVSNMVPVPLGPYDYNGDAVGGITTLTTNGYPAAGGNDPPSPPYLTAAWAVSPTPVGGPIGMSPYLLGTQSKPVVAKTNINTAPFEELWRAFWCVMADAKGPPNASPVNARVGATPPLYSLANDFGGIFRSPSRDPRPLATQDPDPALQFKPTPSQVMQIRSACAAVNAIDLRDGDDDITSREVPIFDMNGAAPALKFRVRVFGNERQPFITKVYVNGYTGASDQDNPDPTSPNAIVNQKGYVAIELYNPYPTPMQLNHWAVGVIYRQTAGYALAGQDPGLHITRLSPRTVPMPTATFDEHYLNQEDPVLGTTTRGQVVIPALGYAVLENYPAANLLLHGVAKDPSDAQWRAHLQVTESWGSGINAKIAFVYVPNLQEVIQTTSGVPGGGELVLLRPRRADGTLTSSTLPNNTYHEAMTSADVNGVVPNLADFVPVDSYDFSGLIQQPYGAGASFPYWFYARPVDTGANAWKFVYPNTYNVALGVPGSQTSPRQTGTNANSFLTLKADAEQTVVFGLANPGTQQPALGFPGIQLQNVDWGKNSTYVRWPALAAGSNVSPVGFPAVPNKVGPYQYPFGGFARNGDMLMVPFIGAYQILGNAFSDGTAKYLLDPTVAPGATQTPNPVPFWEFTPITMDASFADDCCRLKPAGNTQSSWVAQDSTDVAGFSDDADEQIGRFCPIQESTGGAAHVEDLTSSQTAPGINYATTVASGASPAVLWKYHFATRLFDYLTVGGPSDDYLPMVDPNSTDAISSPTPAPATTELHKYPYGNAITDNAAAIAPVAVQNSLNPAAAADHTAATGGIENRLAVDGLININTAPWYVLAQLPLLPRTAWLAHGINANGIPVDIETLAKNIVAYRDNIGGNPRPFTSIFDLNNYFAGTSMSPAQSTIATGNDWDISTGNGTQAPGDFETEYLLMTRLSNLVTTRSDTFTVFIVVDGFRGAGTNDPVLAVHRRAAMIVDRSQMTPEPGSASGQMNVPTQ